MTPEQIKSLQRSFQLIEGKEEIVTLMFYNRLFQQNPALRPLFPGEMKDQAKKLADALKLVHSSIDKFDLLRERLRSLGAKHKSQYGVFEEHYPAFCEALVKTMQETAGTRFDENMKLAWNSLLTQVSAEMQRGARETAQGQSAG